MNSQRHQNEPRQKQGQGRLATHMFILVAGGALAFTAAGDCQQGTTNPLPNRPIVIPNRTLSPDEMRNLNDKSLRKRKFDAANTARKKLIDDETVRLVILALDLKARTDSMGPDAPSPLMLREAAMIEFLANDVKEKMKLTVSPD